TQASWSIGVRDLRGKSRPQNGLARICSTTTAWMPAQTGRGRRSLAAAPLTQLPHSRPGAPLVDLSEWATDGPNGMIGGFKVPVAVSASVYADICAIPADLEGFEDQRGGARDMLWM